MKKFGLILFAVLIVVAFFLFLKADIWDPDFWWHIATGREIVNSGSIPDQDILSFTSGMLENWTAFPERENFILKQYWLAQAIFYLIFKYMGPNGIIVFRSLLFSLIIFFVLLRLHRWAVSISISFFAGFAMFMMILSRLTGDRPVLFTLLFVAVTFFILEDFRGKKDRRIFLLVPLMLLWANFHGGFIVGLLMIAVYMAAEGIKIALKKSEYTKKEISVFYIATALAIGVSFLNPCGWDAFVIALSSKYKAFTAGIQEYDSPYFVFFQEKLSAVDYWYLGSVAFFPLILILRNKKFDLTHLLLLSGLLAASTTALRFVVYYEIVAVMILGREFDAWLKHVFTARFSKETYTKYMNWLAVAACISLLIFVIGIYEYIKDSRVTSSRFVVPKDAVDFVEKSRLKGNMFNDYAFGGYLEWRLHPWKKTFIDSRGLNLLVMNEYSAVATARNSFFGPEPSKTKGPLWERLLDHYNIDIIFITYLDVHGTVLPLVFKLTESEKWVPVYSDTMAVVYVRNNGRNKDAIEKFRVAPDYIYDEVIYKSAFAAMSNKTSPRALMSLGETFYNLGRLKDSLTAYKYAFQRLPSSEIENQIKKIEAELKAEDKQAL